jgi:GT2 family glycosyltransferase
MVLSAVLAPLGSSRTAAREGTVVPDVSFVIPVRNDEANLRRCLASILQCDYTNGRVEIVVVDNGSDDRSAMTARDTGAVVLEEPGLRVGELRNRAARVARGEILAFVDADHEIDAGWIRAAVETLALPNVGGVGALCDPPTPGTWVQRTYGALRGRTPDRVDVSWLGAGNLAVRRSVFERLGGFDPTLESCEDVDLCQRLRTAGHRLVSDPRLRSVHFGDPSTLRALFLGELWRGRDNLRVSFRARPTLAEIPSILIPIVDAALFASVAIGILTLSRGGAWLAGLSMAVFIGLAIPRAVRILVALPRRSRLTALQALAVAIIYDAGRACALLVRKAHRRRRRPSAIKA